MKPLQHLLLACGALLLVSCAGASAPPATPATTATTAKAPPRPVDTTTTTSAEQPAAAASEDDADVVATPSPRAVGPCEVACTGAEIVAHAEAASDYTARALANANEVLGAMNDDLLACYRAGLAANRRAHGFVTVDIVIGPDGHVVHAQPYRGSFAGGAPVSDATMTCMTGRIARATFAPVAGGGTLHVKVPFVLRSSEDAF